LHPAVGAVVKRSNHIGLWVAGCVVAIAVIVGVVGILIPHGGGAGPTATGAPEPTKSMTAGGCNAVSSESTAVPADLRWESANGVTWPVSDSLGPLGTDHGFAVCFAQSPVGAALAAVTSVYAVADHDPIASFDFYTVDTPSKASVLSQLEGATTPKVDLARQLAESGMALVGFQVREFSPTRASVNLVYSAPSSQTGYRTIPRTMVWEDGDWRVKLDDSGNFGESSDATDGDFTRWVN
jgi:hypothetical protein